MADIIPASVDVRSHPHPNSTVSMPSNAPSNAYDASAHPTPFLMAGFNPASRLRRTGPASSSSSSPPTVVNNTGEELLVTVTRPAPGRLAATQLAPVSFVFTPPSIDIPTSANAPEPVQTRPRARSSHDAASPRQVISPRNKKPAPTPVVAPPAQVAFQSQSALPPQAPRKAASPLHADDKFLDFFTTAASIAATQPPSTTSTASSTPVTSSRSVPAVAADEDEEDEEEDDDDAEEEDSETEEERRQRKAAKAARKAERAAKRAAKAAKKAQARKAAKKEKVRKDLKALPAAERERLSNAARWLANVDFYWVRQDNDLSTGTQVGTRDRHVNLGFTKHQVTWRFVLDHRLHELELFHSRFSGKRRIRLDSVELVNEKVLFDGGSSHEIFIGDRMLEVVIFIESKPITFGYELIIEGLPFPRAKDNWIMHAKQALTGYEDQLTTKADRHMAEEALLQHEEHHASKAIARKRSSAS